MKKTPIILLGLALSLMTAGCKKSDTPSPCPWGWGVLSGSNFKITKVTQTSGATVTDVTSQILADPCAKFTINFMGSIETITPAPGCTNGDMRNFTATTENGVNYLNETEQGSSVTNKTVISSSDCNSYTTEALSSGVMQNVTYTKQ
jgi:hypothetical protein